MQQEERTRLDTQGKHLYIGIDSLSTHLLSLTLSSSDFLSPPSSFEELCLLSFPNRFQESIYNIKRLPFEITFDWMVVGVIILELSFLSLPFRFSLTLYAYFRSSSYLQLTQHPSFHMISSFRATSTFSLMKVGKREREG